MSNSSSTTTAEVSGLESTLTVKLAHFASFPLFFPSLKDLPGPTRWTEEMQARAKRAILQGDLGKWMSWTKEMWPEAIDQGLTHQLDGTVFLYAQRPEGARSLLQKAWEIRQKEGTNWEKASTLNNLAVAEMYCGDLESSWKRLSEAGQLWPDLQPIHVNRWCLAQMTGREDWKKEAMAAWKQRLPDWEADELMVHAYEGDRIHVACGF